MRGSTCSVAEMKRPVLRLVRGLMRVGARDGR